MTGERSAFHLALGLWHLLTLGLGVLAVMCTTGDGSWGSCDLELLLGTVVTGTNLENLERAERAEVLDLGT